MIDSHCHFDFPEFDADRETHWQQIQHAGVGALIVPSVGRRNWQKVQTLAENSHGKIHCAFGLHPYFLAEHQAQDIALLSSLLASKPEVCVAVGECGLDWAIADPQREHQEALLVAQQALAIQHNLPMILHCRKAFPDLLRLFKAQFPQQGAVYHAFTGSYQQAKQWVDLGGKIGVGGSITYERANKTRQAIAKLPLSALLLETDAPDMPLFGHQGERNTPARLPEVARMLSALQGASLDRVIEKTVENTNQLFNLS